MRIAVCIKQVPVVSALQFDPQTKTIKRDGVRTEVSPFDIRALLKAVALREEHGGEVVVFTMGPPQAREALLECLALGGDRGVHLCDRAFGGSDTLATAQALAAALRRQPFDVILCGRNSVDAETGQVGPEVAELLDIAQITGARSLVVDTARQRVTAERETDAGIETVEAAMPVLVTAGEDLAPERFVSKAERAAAAEKPIEELSVAALGIAPELIGAAGSPTWVLGLEEVALNRRGQMIAAENLEAAVDELVEHLMAYGLFGSWAEDAPRAAQTEVSVAPREGERDVLVVAELAGGALRPVTLELLAKACELAARLGGSVSCLLAGAQASRLAASAIAHGAQRVLVADDAAVSETTEPCAALLCDVVRAERPGVVLLPSTAFGRDVAPRVAARLQLGLTGDCVDLTVDDAGRLLQHKPAFGGSVVALIASRTRPEMATVRAGMLPLGAARPDRSAPVVAIAVPALASRVRVVSRQLSAEAAVELDEAEVVVGVGKGIGGAEQLPGLAALAKVLGGALCTTRDVTDAGWLPKQLQVGITGRAIAPKLYVAIAVRGAFEHTVGIRRAGLVVAINKSPKAPIFKVADYGLAADFALVVPLLTERLRAAKAARR